MELLANGPLFTKLPTLYTGYLTLPRNNLPPHFLRPSISLLPPKGRPRAAPPPRPHAGGGVVLTTSAPQPLRLLICVL